MPKYRGKKPNALN